ncbi:MAG: Acetoin:2,6-dichlorophenolindophenol oxidoreductase subunit alpha [Syntrophus sp. PtaB.Bin075]|nr:MAG: Acetoin:2,6-dichlorophenolindophenol oxidoreductase subunit alpha [Syntrophus sp. PtaB.Bin075]
MSYSAELMEDLCQLDYSSKFLENLFRMMIRIRYCEESFVEPILRDEVHTPCHLYSGEEAIAVGLCSALSKEDYIFGNHRSHGHFLAKGGSMKAMAAEIYCRITGCSRGRGGSMHLIDPDVGMLGSAPIVAGTISLAAGAALASAIRKDGRVAVSFFGDGATGEGVFYESLNFAALMRLPIIFACENNLYATHMPIRECRVNQPISRIAESFGMEIHSVDGNDVLQVYEASHQAVETCRRGNGPVFMEFMTYRLRGHVGPDDNIQGSHTDIRSRDEIALWMDKDPLKRFEQYLIENRLMGEDRLQDIKDEVMVEVREAQFFAKNSPSPGTEELTKYVFA